MTPTTPSTVAQLSNSDLLARVKHLAGQEREVTVVLIAHLAELDKRRLYLAEGCPSLFTYSTRILHFSEHAAYDRIQAARASRKFPVPDMIRKLPTRAPAADYFPLPSPAAQDAAPGPTPEGDTPSVLSIGRPATEIAPPAAHRAVVTPLAPERYKVQFTADKALHEKIRQAQALLRHQIPDGDLSRIFDRALTALLQDLAKKKIAATERPRTSQGVSRGSRHIPAAVRRAVWSRDEGRCAFVADNGRRCNDEAFVEFHHVVPHAAGGPATVENIQLRCRAHNGCEAEHEFGPRTPLGVREACAFYMQVTGQPLLISCLRSARTRSGPSSCFKRPR